MELALLVFNALWGVPDCHLLFHSTGVWHGTERLALLVSGTLPILSNSTRVQDGIMKLVLLVSGTLRKVPHCPMVQEYRM